MNKRHKWYNEIVAWADGAKIEFKDEADLNEWLDTDAPFWEDGEGIEYRIKPQPKEPQYLYVYSSDMGEPRFFWSKITPLKTDLTYEGKIKLELDDKYFEIAKQRITK